MSCTSPWWQRTSYKDGVQPITQSLAVVLETVQTYKKEPWRSQGANAKLRTEGIPNVEQSSW